MNRKEYIKEVYSKYWMQARKKDYGFTRYDKNICDFIQSCLDTRKRKLLEVAIGTGYPLACDLQQRGYEIHGVDISQTLIDMCNEAFPLIFAKVGHAENLPYQTGEFDLVYCIHSSWFFESIKKVICEMLRVAEPGGYVMFDIQNRDNPKIKKLYKKHIWETKFTGSVWRYIKNTVKVITRKGYPVWCLVEHQTPTYPSDIQNILDSEKNIDDIKIYARLSDASLKKIDGLQVLSKYDRLLYVIKKTMI